ncbi:glyoxylate reductase/hydroxypyruvate reductase-like isoform X3 [Daphnia pulex]|uniref:glyoxylate reductase/hydroxypyruvate reductase-like isoform X2 n=1 Tax=Daphnia pulex TaxID=6669 RepID=UPI001EDF26DD|nr:glyoxylate reductase/hydroxypyruvate reductase-like isoform X2 [Daphnia pulex]XP_046458490.1 glyoxylate reductase/hydroxypyruvate reductase-like isoform X3 [Daphnia pulex]
MLRYFHKISIARNVVDSWVLKPTHVRRFATTSQRMNKPKVLVTRGDIPKSAISILEEKCEVELMPDHSPISRIDILNKISGKDGLFCLLTDKIDHEVLEKAGPQLKVIGTMSVGYDHLDMNEIKKRKISVGYTPNVLTAATAELTVALTLATTRRLFEAHDEITNGGWAKCAWGPLWMCGGGLVGAKVGIVGLGSIGLAVAKRLLPFDIAKIMYCGRQEKPEAAQVSGEYVTFDHLLSESDVVIITCPLNDTTRNMFGPAQFASMKSNSVLINTSRGGVVDQSALVHALKTGQITAAGLDVMTPEPLPVDHELTQLKNCVLIPHIGSATLQTRTTMATMTAQNIVNALEGKPMPAQLC